MEGGGCLREFPQVPREMLWRLREFPQVPREMPWRLRESRKSHGKYFGVCGSSRKHFQKWIWPLQARCKPYEGLFYRI